MIRRRRKKKWKRRPNLSRLNFQSSKVSRTISATCIPSPLLSRQHVEKKCQQLPVAMESDCDVVSVDKTAPPIKGDHIVDLQLGLLPKIPLLGQKPSVSTVLEKRCMSRGQVGLK
jgi:hypothetical protein